MNRPLFITLENPPSRDELVKLIADMGGISVRALLRKERRGLMKNWGLGKISLLTIQLIDFMLQHPS